VINQSYADWEAIVIDDGSTDDSLDIVKRFIESHPGAWKVISQCNQGQCKTRNTGIQESKGEFIAFLDGDDCWAVNKLEVQVAMLAANPKASLVLCPYLISKNDLPHWKTRLVLHRNSKKLLKNWLSLRGFGGGTESTGLARKELLLAEGGFDTNLSTSAGLDLTMRLSRLGTILFANNTYMKYRIHTGQWHTDQGVLSEDLASLRNKIFPSSTKDFVKVKRAHDAYLRFQELRQGVSMNRSNSKDIELVAYFHLFVLVYRILSRTLVARARSIFPTVLTRIPKIYLS
jgi:glycosyltransferase involved in cell wall biosynthesis